MPSRRQTTSAKSAEKTDPLSESVDRLSDEIRCLRQVLDEVREDLSWVTRNGLPVQPVEHIHVKRMARDLNADHWSERLAIERTMVHPPGQLSGLDALDLNRLAEEFRTLVETLTQGQLQPVLNALDEVRAALSSAMQRQKNDHPVGKPETRSVSGSTSSVQESPPQTARSPDAPPGRLF